jgi:hypothetical protein
MMHLDKFLDPLQVCQLKQGSAGRAQSQHHDHSSRQQDTANAMSITFRACKQEKPSAQMFCACGNVASPACAHLMCGACCSGYMCTKHKVNRLQKRITKRKEKEHNRKKTQKNAQNGPQKCACDHDKEGRV